MRIKVAINENLQEGRTISNILLNLDEPKDQAASSRFFGICDILFERFNIAKGITKIDCPIATKNNEGSYPFEVKKNLKLIPIRIKGTTRGVKKNKFRKLFPLKFEFTKE